MVCLTKTKPNEFIKFHKALMNNAPEGYIPWYFPVVKNNKAPDPLGIKERATKETPKELIYSWKAKHAQLSFEEALKRLEQGKNVGIAARDYDFLVIIDIDEWDYKDEIPDTLLVKSRKRCGLHGFCWKKSTCDILPVNIPTEHGEIRSADQYVVAAGSYVPTSLESLNEEKISNELKEEIKQDINLGVYTVEQDIKPLFISFEDVPDFFKEQYFKVSKQEKVELKNETIRPTGEHSALFDLTISNIVGTVPGKRDPHPLHASDTGANFSVSNGISHCWRHSVSLNAIQFLVVESGYMSCQDAGTGHKNSGAGSSMVKGDYGAIFHAWLQAKKDNLIPKDDPIPTKAMAYIAYNHKLIPIENKDDFLPIEVYNEVLRIVEEKY